MIVDEVFVQNHFIIHQDRSARVSKHRSVDSSWLARYPLQLLVDDVIQFFQVFDSRQDATFLASSYRQARPKQHKADARYEQPNARKFGAQVLRSETNPANNNVQMMRSGPSISVSKSRLSCSCHCHCRTLSLLVHPSPKARRRSKHERSFSSKVSRREKPLCTER